jgi:hypothetical protein
VPTPASILRDLRTLGAGAPLRVAHEASIRSGLHDVVLPAVARWSSPATFRAPFALPPAGSVPPQAAARTLEAAARIASGETMAFGRWAPPGFSDVAWPAEPWWQLDLAGAGRAGDVRQTWEPARHHDLVVLARAAQLDPAGPWLDHLSGRLATFLEANPPEIGVHWASNLELAVRALAWIEVLARVGDDLDGQLRAATVATLRRIGRHLVIESVHTFSLQFNNHWLGDAVALGVFGRAFDDPVAHTWGRFGDAVLTGWVQRGVRADGTTIEDSLGYHRFVLDLVAARVLAGGAPMGAVAALAGGGRALCRLGALEGPLPVVGDDDDGRALAAVPVHGHDLSGSARLALALAGTGAPPAWRAAHDECAWYAPAGEPVPAPPAERDGHDAGGGLVRVERGPWQVMLKAGTRPSHPHSDLLAATVARDGAEVVHDPGTGAYLGPRDERNWLRSSGAHPVLELDGRDQLDPVLVFRMAVTGARAVPGPPIEVDGWLLAWGAHDAYLRLTPPRRVARLVAVRDGDRPGCVVADWWEGGAARWSLAWPLPDGPDGSAGADPSDSGVVVLDRDGPVDLLAVSTQRSPGYGRLTPATRIEASGTGRSPVVSDLTGVGTDDARRPGDPDRTAGVAIRDDSVVLGADGPRLSVEFAGHAVWLVVDHGGGRTEARGGLRG